MTTPTLCDIYAIPSLTWPQQQFPGDAPQLSRLSQGEKLSAKKAWNFYEQVEAIDAATRVRIGTSGGMITASPWFAFAGEGERALYEKGRRLHMLLCPSLVWTPQRNLPIPAAIPGTVAPAECPAFPA